MDTLLPIWAYILGIPLTLLYALMGGFLFVFYRESIVIKNRQPELVIIEQLSAVLNALFCVIVFLPSVDVVVNCEVMQMVFSVSTMISLILMLARMSFVYSCLMSCKEDVYHFGLNKVSQVFWKEHQLKKLNLFMIILVFVVASFMNIWIFDGITGIYSRPLSFHCPGESIMVLIYFNYFAIFLLCAFSIQFIRHRILDQIWMSIEVVSFTATLILVLCLYIIVNGRYDIYGVYLQSIITIFFGFYFPLMAHYKHVLKIKRSVSKASLLNDQVMELCRNFYCEENGIFLDNYEKYKQGMITSDYLITMFIEDSAPFELNINYTIKEAILKNNEEERKIHLEKAYQEIKLLIQTNILPYVKRN